MCRKQYSILVVDDEPDICEILQFNLETEGYAVESCQSAERALEMINSRPDGYDLLLLDVMMSPMSGFALARLLKQQPATAAIPVIFITARDTENDLITGLNIGADDYIAKPFSLREVMARVKAVLRRCQRKEESFAPKAKGDALPPLQYKGLKIDREGKTVSVDGKEATLTKTEYDILTLLLENPRRVFSRGQMIAEIWRDDVIVLDRTVDVNITRLRRKIAPYGANIKTRQGFGYSFVP